MCAPMQSQSRGFILAESRQGEFATQSCWSWMKRMSLPPCLHTATHMPPYAYAMHEHIPEPHACIPTSLSRWCRLHWNARFTLHVGAAAHAARHADGMAQLVVRLRSFGSALTWVGALAMLQ